MLLWHLFVYATLLHPPVSGPRSAFVQSFLIPLSPCQLNATDDCQRLHTVLPSSLSSAATIPKSRKTPTQNAKQIDVVARYFQVLGEGFVAITSAPSGGKTLTLPLRIRPAIWCSMRDRARFTRVPGVFLARCQTD